MPARAISHPKVSIVVPALNEARNLELVMPELPADAEIIVVDGHSSDDTQEVARRLRPDAVVLEQTRKGKGNALVCGFAAATGDVIVMFDADCSADPAEIPSFVAALVAGADFAKGSRCAPGGGSDDITVIRDLGNRALNVLTNLVIGARYSDLCYGYNAFWADILPSLRLPDPTTAATGPDGRVWGDGFEIETLLTYRVAAAQLDVTEVPSHERSRVHGVSNLNAVSDGLRVLKTIMRERKSFSGRPQAPRSERAVRDLLEASEAS